MLRIGMLTSGGDCQALNAAMRGVVKGICNKRKDVEIYGFKDGYKGLIYSDFNMLTSRDFSGILTQGGTILGTSRQQIRLTESIQQQLPTAVYLLSRLWVTKLVM